MRVWDGEGNVSAWSEPACFGVGLLHPEDWTARYIGMNQAEGQMESPLFRKTFQCNTLGEKMLLHVNSLGYHEVYVNGKHVGDAVLTPAVSQFDKRSLIVTYDISELVRKGSNEIVFWLGKGWYRDGLPGVVEGGRLSAPNWKAETKEIGLWFWLRTIPGWLVKAVMSRLETGDRISLAVRL